MTLTHEPTCTREPMPTREPTPAHVPTPVHEPTPALRIAPARAERADAAAAQASVRAAHRFVRLSCSISHEVARARASARAARRRTFGRPLARLGPAGARARAQHFHFQRRDDGVRERRREGARESCSHKWMRAASRPASSRSPPCSRRAPSTRTLACRLRSAVINTKSRSAGGRTHGAHSWSRVISPGHHATSFRQWRQHARATSSLGK